MSELGSSLRRLRRSPSRVAASVLSLGVGVAICVTVFSLTNALVFNDIAGITERRTLIRIDWTNHGGQFTVAEFESFEAQQPAAFTTVAAQGDQLLPVVLPSGPTTISAAFVSAHFFEALGTRALQGRLLNRTDAESAAPVVVISEELWRETFNSDLGILGGALMIGGRAFTIVGVTPAAAPGLRVVDVTIREHAYPQVWLSLGNAVHWRATSDRNRPWLSTAGRLAASSSLANAKTQTGVIAGRLGDITSSMQRDQLREHASLQLFRSGLDWRDEPAQSLLVLGVFLLVPLGVLGIGCVNVVNLQLARAMDQAGELSVRLALGASRIRLVRLLTTEVATLTVMSGAIGWLGARLLVAYARSFSPAPIAIDNRALGFSLVLVALVTAAAGVLPAWIASRDVVAAGLRVLRDGTPLRARLRSLLVVVQVAASLTLLALSGLAMRSLLVQSPVLPPDAAQILVTDLSLTDVRATEARPDLFIDAVLNRLQQEPSIEAAAFATFRTTVGGPLQYWTPAGGSATARVAFGGFVTPKWFEATQATFLAGHAPQRSSALSVPVVINAAVASTLGDSGPGVLGTELRVPDQARRQLVSATVVGVVANTQLAPDGKPLPMLYLPMPAGAPSILTLIARPRDTTVGRRAIEIAVREADPLLPLGRIESLDGRVSDSNRGLREGTWFGLALGMLALGLAAAGLHSLLAYMVRSRTREIGIRVAVGAHTGNVVWLVLKPGLWMVLAGAMLGFGGAVAFATLMRAVFVGVSPLDPAALLPSVLVLFLVSLAAGALPAYRASRLNPVEALRYE